MERRQLGRTDLRVSVLGLGTMTWGEQNTEAQAHAQLDMAVDAGVNLIDAAEMYPVPPQAHTQGLTESYLGSWLRRPGNRERVVVATKITGPGPSFTWLRDGATRYTAEHLQQACEGSLKRLGIETIDLYQLHWPERPTNYFGELGYTARGEAAAPIDEALRGLEALVQAGKVRHIGLSNETPWGVSAFLEASRAAGLPRVVSVQNPYNLLNRSFEVGLAEFAHREQTGLLAYSPLAMGVLSGKYEGGKVWPPDARLTKFSRFTRYVTPAAFAAADAYVALAKEHDLDPAQLALAYVNSRPFLTSNLIAATTSEQLASNLASAELRLSPEVLDAIEAIHRRNPNPCP